MADTDVSTVAEAADAMPSGEREAGEPAALRGPPTFDELVAAEQTRVTRLAYRLLGWRQDVDDVVQDVFVAVLRSLPKFRGESDVSTWVTRITINTCRTHLRRRVLRLRVFRDAPPEPPPAPPNDLALLDRERFDHVRRAISRLPVKYREVVVLRYLDELPVARIADVLNLSKPAVEVRLNRARKRLRESLAGLLEE